ncbi:hypothetical protein PR202_gb22978 [Eleusine coracana subsp. coracana]|uniref:Protein kinase domain-containing protein n=1 Tax=Eleusine coracana subsp. coracana TaxID=191504 RepID=A0AAV5FI05_ELECO|nr:hypothetical protein QOZ80_6BG0484170 [Eleusine coracana subsp. coracana]GJN34328.1 hypothetical protein PR202_gb22978 [Eleusine coracana subsp. coracana]
MSSAEVDESPPAPARGTKRTRAPPHALITKDTAKLALLTFILMCYLTVELLYPPSRSTLTPTSVTYPKFAKAAVEKATAISNVVSTNEYSYTGSKVLGNGTFGYVFTARHRVSNDVVAVKSLRTDRDHDGNNRSYTAGAAEILGEARALAAAGGHPSVVALRAIAVHPTTGELYLVMDHAGRSLGLELYRNRSGAPFPERDVRRAMRRLLAAVAHMHSRGVVHRDVKPENILVVGSGSAGAGLLLDGVKICDLGVAMFADEPGPRVRVGTSQYMAPEILAGRTDYGDKVDMWSLGCVMAELLTGRPVFYAPNDDDAAQMRVIFDVLGPPCPGYNSSEQHDDDKVATTLQNVSDHRNRLRDLFPEQNLSDEGFDVLKGLLSCDIDQRLSATDALRLPWFASDAGEEAPSALHLPLRDRASWTWIFSHRRGIAPERENLTTY